MAGKSSSLVVLCVVIAAMCGVNGASDAAAPAPAPVDCSSVVLTMADCLSYVTNDSTSDAPEGNCCSGLKSVLSTTPHCLCEIFKNSAQFGITLNETRARNLPSACKVPPSSAPHCGTKEAPPVGDAPPADDAKAPSEGSTGPITDASPAPTTTTESAASALFHISTESLLICLFIALVLAF